MENIVERLHNAFEDIIPTLHGVYIGQLRSEMESMFHLAYWLYSDGKTDINNIQDMVFKMAPFKIGETTKPDLIFLINKAKELC